MPRALFQKTGNAIFTSHLDLMRVFQRAFKRAGLPLTHTQGYNPRPSVSIALPLSLGVESFCELLDFDLEGESLSPAEIKDRLNQSLIDGVTVLDVLEETRKIKHIAYLDCQITLEYDKGIPANAQQDLMRLFDQEHILVEKKGKNGVSEQDIIPMIRMLFVTRDDENTLRILARICCQNPTLNPVQIVAAIEKYLPQYKPDHATILRMEIYDAHV